jgi:hypothetical protein
MKADSTNLSINRSKTRKQEPLTCECVFAALCVTLTQFAPPTSTFAPLALHTHTDNAEQLQAVVHISDQSHPKLEPKIEMRTLPDRGHRVAFTGQPVMDCTAMAEQTMSRFSVFYVFIECCFFFISFCASCWGWIFALINWHLVLLRCAASSEREQTSSAGQVSVSDFDRNTQISFASWSSCCGLQ